MPVMFLIAVYNKGYRNNLDIYFHISLDQILMDKIDKL